MTDQPTGSDRKGVRVKVLTHPVLGHPETHGSDLSTLPLLFPKHQMKPPREVTDMFANMFPLHKGKQGQRDRASDMGIPPEEAPASQQ